MASSYEETMKTLPYLPYNMGDSLPEALIAKAKKELGETEEVKEKTIPQLRRLIQAEPGLICPTDDAYLLQYLRARKFNVQKAFSLLKNYYKVKISNDDMYGSCNREALMRAINMKIGFLLPYRDKDGCTIAVLRMRKWDVDVLNATEDIIGLTLTALWCVQEPANQICGVRLLVDVRGANLKQIRSLIPRHVILLAKAFTNALPIRFKGIHFYNESPIFHQVISILKLFLTEKMRNRVHLHGDNQKHLNKFIPKEILPAEDFGGEYPNDITVWFNAELEKYLEKYRQMMTYGYKNNDF